MPTYTYRCARCDRAETLNVPVQKRDESTPLCGIPECCMQRVVEAPQRTPGNWYTGDR